MRDPPCAMCAMHHASRTPINIANVSPSFLFSIDRSGFTGSRLQLSHTLFG